MFFVGSDSKHGTGLGFLLTVKNGTSTGKNTDDVIFLFLFFSGYYVRQEFL